MADNSTQIDELRLDITVEDKTSGESSDKKVKNLAAAISRLNNNLQAFDNKKMSNVFANMAKGIDPFVQKINKVSGALNSLATIVSKMGIDKAVEETTKSISPLQKETVSGDSRAETKIQAQQGTAQQLEQIQNIAKSTSSSILGITTKVEILKKKLEMVNAELQKDGLTEKQLVQLKNQQLSIQEQINKAEGKKPKVPLSNLLKSFGRIAVYRAIRTVIKEITQAFTEGIGGLARYNDEVNQSMTKITSSFAQVKASISIALYQPLIMLEPIITAVSQGIVSLSNGLSFLFAKLRGASTYMRVNTEYLKDYKSALDGTLLSFDTFETLGKGKGIDYSQMFEEVETSSSSFSEALGNIKNILIEISGILLAIGGYKIIKWIAEGGIKNLINGLSGIKTKINDISTAGLIAGASFAFLASIVNLIDVIKNWDSQSLITKITAITAAALGLAAVVFSILAAIPAIGHTAVFKALAVGTAAVGTLVGVVSAMKFADGGMFEGAGTMYAIAGESGAEVVAQGSAGTGVLNVDQFADAMVSALVRYGAARDNGSGTTIVLDGNKVGQLVASNAGFRNEANRRNAGLNWK